MYMSITEKDEVREDRIIMDIIVDAYNSEEQAMGWYYYLDDKIKFPFEACCMEVKGKSPLKEGEKVTVLHMADAENCDHGMLVNIQWRDRIFAVPLEQLKPLTVEEQTQEAVEDWHYWVARGYEL